MQDDDKVINFSTKLGTLIDQEWSRDHFEIESFPHIALKCITELQPQHSIGENDIVDAVLSGTLLPKQSDPSGEFGDASITLFWGKRFFIDALFWLNSSTTIHDHAFYGAFAVLNGSSFHSNYDFSSGSPAMGAVRLGDLRRNHSEILGPGSVREIRANHTLHSLVHLDRPTISLVVRTRKLAGLSQHVYLNPGLAYDPRSVNDNVRKSCQLLKIDYQISRDAFFLRFRRGMHFTNATDACQLLLECGDFLEWDDLARAANIAAETHTELDGTIQPAVFDAITQARLRDARRLIQSPRLRLLLALLAVRANKSLARAMLFDLLRSDRSTDPLFEAVSALAAESEAERLGAYLEYPLASGNVRVLMDLMRGYTEDEIAIALGGSGQRTDLLDEVRAIRALCRSSLFAPLL